MSEIARRLAGLSAEQRELLLQRLKRQQGQQQQAEARPAPITRRKGDEDTFPLSYAQQRLWFLQQLEPTSAFYNVPAAVRLCGSLNVAALTQALNEITRRHEALRTTFISLEGEPRQQVSPALTIELPVVDLSATSAAEKDAQAQRIAQQEAARAFDLSVGPLLRVSLLRVDEEEHILLLVMHHIISDGWSMGILVRELGTLYEAYTKGEDSPLGELPIQYADYALWQREYLRGAQLERQLAYWREQLGGRLPVLELPADRPRPGVQSYRGATLGFELSEGLSEQLGRLAQREGVTLFMLLLTVFKVLLSRYTGEEDILVGTPIAGRRRVETEGLIGFFVNTLVLRTRIRGGERFGELCRE